MQCDMIWRMDNETIRDMIKDAAISNGPDLSHPDFEYSLWTLDGGVQFCGNSKDLNSLRAHARKHAKLKSLYILPADTTKGLVAIPDTERDPEPPA